MAMTFPALQGGGRSGLAGELWGLWRPLGALCPQGTQEGSILGLLAIPAHKK